MSKLNTCHRTLKVRSEKYSFSHILSLFLCVCLSFFKCLSLCLVLSHSRGFLWFINSINCTKLAILYSVSPAGFHYGLPNLAKNLFLQGDQLYMAVCCCYPYHFTRVLLHALQKSLFTKYQKTRPCLSGQVVYKVVIYIFSSITVFYIPFFCCKIENTGPTNTQKKKEIKEKCNASLAAPE